MLRDILEVGRKKVKNSINSLDIGQPIGYNVSNWVHPYFAGAYTPTIIDGIWRF